MAKKDGKSFEKLVGQVYEVISATDHATIVGQDEQIEGPEGNRQFDVVLRSKVAGEEIVTIIECKDYKRPVDVTVVDAFQSKLNDVNANKGIIVSRNGFSGKAERKARRSGITLCTVDELSNKLESPFASLPVLCRRIDPGTIGITVHFADDTDSPDGIKIDANSTVFGFGLMDLVRLADFKDLMKSKKIKLNITAEMVGGKLWLPTPNGGCAEIEECILDFEIPNDVLAGYASDLTGTAIKIDEEKSISELFIDAQDFKSVSDRFQKYDSFDKVPQSLKRTHLAAVLVPKSVSNIGNVQMFGKHRDTGAWEQIQPRGS